MNPELILFYAMCLYTAFLIGYVPRNERAKKRVFWSVTSMFWGCCYITLIQEFVHGSDVYWVFGITCIVLLTYWIYLYVKHKRKVKSFYKQHLTDYKDTGDYMHLTDQDIDEQD